MWMRRTLLILPFVGPFAFHQLYQPINVAWTVERFGCGCPPVRGERPFNANQVNLALWVMVALGCGLSWWFVLRFEFGERRAGSRAFLALQTVGIVAVIGLCLNRWGREFWL
jgi:hypothetical protein